MSNPTSPSVETENLLRMSASCSASWYTTCVVLMNPCIYRHLGVCVCVFVIKFVPFYFNVKYSLMSK